MTQYPLGYEIPPSPNGQSALGHGANAPDNTVERTPFRQDGHIRDTAKSGTIEQSLI